MKTIGEWQKEAHALAVEKGFHEGKDPFSQTRIGARIALIHAEISEALECVARGRMELYYTCPRSRSKDPTQHTEPACSCGDERKPEGFGIELADVFLRLCDFAESVSIQLDTPDLAHKWELDTDPESVADALNSLHTSLAATQWSAPDEFPIDADALDGFLAHLFLLAESQGIDLLAMAELKHAYNRTRPIMHGGKKL